MAMTKEEILKRNRVEKEEMWDFYRSNYAFEPNNTRVGNMAKELGFKPWKQMVNRKIIRFYIKNGGLK